MHIDMHILRCISFFSLMQFIERTYILHKEDPKIKIYFCTFSHQSNMPTVMKYIVFVEYVHGADMLDAVSIEDRCLYEK